MNLWYIVRKHNPARRGSSHAGFIKLDYPIMEKKNTVMRQGSVEEFFFQGICAKDTGFTIPLPLFGAFSLHG